MMNDTSSSSHLGFCQPSTVCLADTTLLSPPLPEPVVVTKTAPKEEKKPVKKRKSWGQELPVPKTNLPPRKRAKTEDEKEQRRIERVLRNRQAAQSSRERKRQEVEKLEGERDVINQQNHLLRQRLLQVEEEKFKLKQEVMEMRALLGKQTGAELTPSATPSPLLRSEMFHEKPDVKSELADLPLFPTEHALDTPVSALTPKDDPLPAPLDLTGTATSIDLTQHPAAVLCDLQCQSEEASQPTRLPAATSDGDPWDHARALATQHLFLTIHLSIFSTAVTPLCQLLASLKKGSRLRTPTVTPMLFTLILWLISTPRSPLRSTTSSTLAPSIPPPTSTPSTSSPSTTRSSTFRTSLLRRFLTCSPALARPLKDATARALHMKASRYALRESSDGSGRPVEKAVEGVPGGAGGATSKAEVWRLMAMILVIDQWEKDRIKAGKSV